MRNYKKILLNFWGHLSSSLSGPEVLLLQEKRSDIPGIALAFGISVLVMVYAIGQISGCHINPAITIAMLVNRKIGSKDAALYIVVQCIGAIIVSLILLAIMTGLAGYDLATNGLGQNGGGRFPGGFSSRRPLSRRLS